MRPTYETSGDLSNEFTLARYAEVAWRCQLRKQDKFNQFDYIALRNGKVKAFVEMRTRNILSSSYPTCFISVNKLQAAQSMYLATGLPCLFLVRWSDAVGYADMLQRYNIIVGGRVDRNDAADIEALGEIPISQFKMI
jgi:hypothetical protein